MNENRQLRQPCINFYQCKKEWKKINSDDLFLTENGLNELSGAVCTYKQCLPRVYDKTRRVLYSRGRIIRTVVVFSFFSHKQSIQIDNYVFEYISREHNKYAYSPNTGMCLTGRRKRVWTDRWMLYQQTKNTAHLDRARRTRFWLNHSRILANNSLNVDKVFKLILRQAIQTHFTYINDTLVWNLDTVMRWILNLTTVSSNKINDWNWNFSLWIKHNNINVRNYRKISYLKLNGKSTEQHHMIAERI